MLPTPGRRIHSVCNWRTGWKKKEVLSTRPRFWTRFAIPTFCHPHRKESLASENVRRPCPEPELCGAEGSSAPGHILEKTRSGPYLLLPCVDTARSECRHPHRSEERRVGK